MNAALMAQRFDIPGQLVTVMPYGDGNVNDTYKAIFRTTFSEERFIIQRINSNVFSNPEDIMSNMRVITEHVHRRLENETYLSDRIWQLPRIVETKDGKDFTIDGDGSVWRGISYIHSARAFEKVQSIDHAHEAGMVLGQFQRLISDIPVDSLKDTLQGFHITPKYLEKFDAVMETNEGKSNLDDLQEAHRCVQFIEERRDWCSILEDARNRGELKVRPIHGDPKVANIMIDTATGKGTCMVDLDTVKPGLIHYDFGDCLRSACNLGGEENGDLEQVNFDTDYCSAIVKGYMRMAGDFLTDNDRNYLYDSIRLITFELGLRFFTDFLAGNKYFKTHYDLQNLNRARVQFKLCESIERQESTIKKILNVD